MKLIQHQELGSNQASFVFNSIPQTYTDLVLVFSARSNRTSAPVDTVRARFNGITTGYSYQALEGTGSGYGSFTGSSFNAGICATDACTANTFGSTTLYITNYTSGVAKSATADGISENSATGANQFITGSLWTGTAPITSIEIAPETGTEFKQFSSATLFGITKGSNGIVTIS